MNITEFNKVKDMTYLEYCDYLQDKYGIGLCDYMTPNWSKKVKCSRTTEGLIAHHKMEDRAIMLSNREVAKDFPFEFQLAKNIVYCDYLEHFLLHVLICKLLVTKYPRLEKVPVGIGSSVEKAFIPELNDLYSGFKTKQAWRKVCHERVINDKDAYLAILKMYIDKFIPEKKDRKRLFRSYNNEMGGNWDINNNMKIFYEIFEL